MKLADVRAELKKPFQKKPKKATRVMCDRCTNKATHFIPEWATQGPARYCKTCMAVVMVEENGA